MIFNEVFGAYTRTVGLLINRAIEESGLSSTDVRRIIEDNAFRESFDYIKEILNPSSDEPAFPLINKDASTRKYISVLDKPYKRPVTVYELRWLKAVSQDPRIKLFCDSFPELDGLEPLFNPEDIIYYDQNTSGDDFTCQEYIAVFRILLTAIKEKHPVEITRDNDRTFTAIPIKLEYSPKDNRFRLVTAPGNSRDSSWYVNLSSIRNVRLTDSTVTVSDEPLPRDTSRAVLEITDEKDAMERICLSFSHLERTSERIDRSHYRLTVTYDRSDWAEMVIKIMSFGKYVKVIEPEDIRISIENRVKKQMELLCNWNTEKELDG